jgi:hypothetical protein
MLNIKIAPGRRVVKNIVGKISKQMGIDREGPGGRLKPDGPGGIGREEAAAASAATMTFSSMAGGQGQDRRAG